MGNKQERLDNIAFLNVVAIVLVILGHSGCVYADKWHYTLVYENSSIIRYITEYIYSFHMPLFVFISGYLYCYGKNMGKYICFKTFIIKKIRRLIIPYFVTGALIILPIKIMFHLDVNSASYFERVLNEILLAKSTSHLWFILMLFNLFIIFYFIEKYLNRTNMVVSILILLIISIVSRKLPNIYQVSQALQYLIFFYVGYVFYKNRYLINEISDKWSVLFIIQLILFNVDYFTFNNLSSNKSSHIFVKLFNVLCDKIIAFIGIAFIFTMVQFLFSKNEDKMNRFNSGKLYGKISKNSFYIYLVHQPIMLVILNGIRDIPIQPIFVFNILFWSTLIISFGLVEFYNRGTKKISKLKRNICELEPHG